METQQVRRLLLALVIAFSIICIHHSQQTIQSESETQLRLDNNVLIHLSLQMHKNHNDSRRMRQLILLKLPHQTQTPTNDRISYPAVFGV